MAEDLDRAVAQSIALFSMLSGAPLDRLGDAAKLLKSVCVRRSVTCAELKEAARRIVETERFWPQPSVVLEAVRQVRLEAQTNSVFIGLPVGEDCLRLVRVPVGATEEQRREALQAAIGGSA